MEKISWLNLTLMSIDYHQLVNVHILQRIPIEKKMHSYIIRAVYLTKYVSCLYYKLLYSAWLFSSLFISIHWSLSQPSVVLGVSASASCWVLIAFDCWVAVTFSSTFVSRTEMDASPILLFPTFEVDFALLESVSLTVWMVDWSFLILCLGHS